ncbi:unnamed protein product [Closterium sp. NIES-54]
MSHSKQPRSQGKRKDGKNRPRGGARGGAESSMGDPFALSEERLASLDLEGGLNQRRDFSEACRELSLLLRLCYSHSPKPVQSHLYSLAQQAIANLPCVDGALHRSAAHQLIQACQAALPRQRKQAVTSEYKRLCVMLARAGKKSESAVEEEEEENDEEENDEEENQETYGSNGSTKQGFQPLNFERCSSMVPLLPTSQTCSISSTPPSLPPLPSDILHLLFSHLDPLSLARASAVCFHWREIAAAAEPDWVTHLAACLGSVPAAEARESRGGKGQCGGEVQERKTPLWQDIVSWSAQGSSLSSLQSNRVLCKECSMVAWTPNSAPTPPPHTTYPPPRSDAPSLSASTLSSTQFSRNKTKGRGGIVTPGSISAGTGVGAGASGRGTGTGASWVASVPGGSSAAAGRACKAGCEAVEGRDATDRCELPSRGGSSGNGSGSVSGGGISAAARFFGRTCRVKSATRRGYRMQQHAWKLAGTAKVVASLSDEFEGEESSDEDGGVGRTGYHSNTSTVSRFW